MAAATTNDAPEELPKESVFDGMVFTIIPSRSYECDKLAEKLLANGGEYIPYNANQNKIQDLPDITHIISTTSDFPDYHTALDHYVNVVKHEWVEISIRKLKAMNPRPYSPDPAYFLSGVMVFVASDIPNGDKEAIIGGVIAMGGQHSRSMSKQVTHMVALSVDNDQCRIALRKNLSCYIILPHWFDDCLKLGRRIAEGPYQLPNAEILDPNPVARFIDHPPVRAITGATTPQPTDFTLTPQSSPSSRMPRCISVFRGRTIKLGADLSLAQRLFGTIVDLIQAGDGSITDNVEDATMYVCQYRRGSDYITASQNGIDVGNLNWLYYLITHNTWTSPMRRLLHYPVPKDGIEGFHGLKVTLSNYIGEARIYLESLVEATGAEFTRAMNQHNTHLITAHMGSEKCVAAQEWGIEIVNHLWLEESYARCQKLPLSTQKFTHFPKRTNLGEVLGQTEIDRVAVEQLYFPPDDHDVLQEEGNAISKPSSIPGSSTVHQQNNSFSDQQTPVGKKSHRLLQDGRTRTPSGPQSFESKENETPSSTGSRGAKARALTKLHDLAPDVALYDKEMKRKGGVVYGGRRGSVEDLVVPNRSKSESLKPSHPKRSIDAVESEDADSAEEVQRGKKKKAGKPPIRYRMMVSKYEGWVENLKKEDADKSKLRELGITITEGPQNVNLLCVPKIVSTSFLDECLNKNRVPDPEKHILEDTDSETLYGFRIDESIARAAQNKRHLLRGWTIFCTDAVGGGWEAFKDIISANGSNCCLWKGRTKMTVSRRAIGVAAAVAEETQNQVEDEGDVLYLVSELKESEVPLWKKFRALAQSHDMLPRIVSTEWLLFITVAQYVTYRDEWELNEEKLAAESKKK